ncbi:uncharacterized protein LOC121807188 [Salvia splendens]|uniref:uncharacterized protein LOC121807188 n=1 Tax=Salvia splendens TaxID=180675 RepID=UPI001C253C1E|nr:uncharacterized protein LOC121807188 [Salvia splendens]
MTASQALAIATDSASVYRVPRRPLLPSPSPTPLRSRHHGYLAALHRRRRLVQHLRRQAPPYHHLRSSSSLTKPIQLTVTAPCSYPLLQHDFSFTYGQPPVLAAYTPPPHCPSPSSAKIVLEWTVTCKDRQFDRILDSVSPGNPWRRLFPDDLCSSAPHGVVCDFFYTSAIPRTSLSSASDMSPTTPPAPSPPPATLTPPSPRNSSLEELIFIEIGGAEGLLVRFRSNFRVSVKF